VIYIPPSKFSKLRELGVFYGLYHQERIVGLREVGVAFPSRNSLPLFCASDTPHVHVIANPLSCPQLLKLLVIMGYNFVALSDRFIVLRLLIAQFIDLFLDLPIRRD
jgi:hypothetical protein